MKTFASERASEGFFVPEPKWIARIAISAKIAKIENQKSTVEMRATWGIDENLRKNKGLSGIANADTAREKAKNPEATNYAKGANQSHLFFRHSRKPLTSAGHTSVAALAVRLIATLLNQNIHFIKLSMTASGHE